MFTKAIKTGVLALGIAAAIAGINQPAKAAAIGIVSPSGNPVSTGHDNWDSLTLTPISNSINQVVFKATLIGGGMTVPYTSAFTYLTDASNQIRDVLYVDLSDNGSTSTLYFDYVAHGHFGTPNAPVGTIIDPSTLQTINLASLPKVSGLPEVATHINGYVINGDLKDVNTGMTSAFVPYLAVYVYANEPVSTPEPASLLLLPVGLAGVLFLRRRNK